MFFGKMLIVHSEFNVEKEQSYECVCVGCSWDCQVFLDTWPIKCLT